MNKKEYNEWYRNNHKQEAKEYYIKHKEKAKEYYKSYSSKYYEKNKEKTKKYYKNTRHKTKIIIINKLGGKCVCCGVSEWWNLTLDHIIPSAKIRNQWKDYKDLRDGVIGTDNFQLLCFGCNSSKGRNLKCTINHNI